MTSRQGQSGLSTSCGLRKFGLLGAAIVATFACAAAPSPARADLIQTYTISSFGIACCLDTSLGDFISGTFVYDVTKGTLTSVNLTVTGSYMPGIYDATDNAFTNPGDTAEISACIARVCTRTSDILHIWFGSGLNGSSDQIIDVSWDAGAKEAPIDLVFARAIPEPASLVLLGTALAGLGAIRRRRRRA